MKSGKTIDIIIPVYNAVEELKECISSLLNYTSYENHRVIIINDCSPDYKINEYLNTIDTNEKMIVLQNEINLGFVGTVNKGMTFSENDVVLLNSDTIVTKRWLEKLKKAAYIDQSIATVTPLTNNGTICSVPNFCEDNSIPEGYTIDSFAELIERISFEKFPEIPTAVGFCMYIKREVINRVGLFDEETFGKGYAEENDFCCRAIEHGFKNIIADNTFIYHKGSMSFQGDKLKLLKKNLKTLNNRYPYYENNVHNFVTNNPLKEIHDNINIQLEFYKNNENSGGNILFVLHNFFDEKYNHSIGGTEYHVKDIVTNLDAINAFVMVTNNKEIIVKKYNYGKLIGKYRFNLDQPIGLTHFSHKQYKELVEKIIHTFEIGLIHIHHLRNHTFDLPYIAKKLNLKVIYTLHDFHFFCPKVNLLDENNQYCIDIRGELKCQQCLKKEYQFNTPFISVWKEQVQSMMENIDLFICPSKTTENMFREEFNLYFEKNNNIITIEHGVSKTDIETKVNKVINKPLKFGFLGGLSPTKGSNLIFEVITEYSKKNVEWHLIGELGDQKLNLLEQSNVIKHGAYKRENLSELLLNIDIDIICLFSPWPETYSYTLTESWIQNIPVLVLPMGALKERVEKVGGGWITEDVTKESVFESIDHIIKLTPVEWMTVSNNIQDYYFKSNEEMAKEYINLYKNHISIKPAISSVNTFNNYEILNSIKYFLPSNESMSEDIYNNKLNEMQTELESIKSTIGWKVLNKFREKSPLFLKVGKKVIFRVLK